MTTPPVPDPWEGLPDGTLAPFLDVDHRDRLIVDRTVIRVLSIEHEETKYGPKVYVRIAIPPDQIERTCAFDKKDKSHPRLKVLAGLQEWMLRYPEQPLHAVLIGAGNGYMLGKPPVS